MANPFDNVSFGAPVQQRPTQPLFPAAPAESPQQSIGNSIIEQLLAQIKGGDNPTTSGTSDMSRVLGGLADSEEARRIAKGNFAQNYDQTMLTAQTGRNQNEIDALKKIAITNYLKSGGFKGGPASIMMEGQLRQLPSYGSAPRPASAAQMESAGTLEDMLKQRLASGGSYLPQPLESYADPGMLEKISGYGGAATAGLGAINKMMEAKGGSKGNVLNAIGGGLKKVGGGIIGGLRNLF